MEKYSKLKFLSSDQQIQYPMLLFLSVNMYLNVASVFGKPSMNFVLFFGKRPLVYRPDLKGWSFRHLSWSS